MPYNQNNNSRNNSVPLHYDYQGEALLFLTTRKKKGRANQEYFLPEYYVIPKRFMRLLLKLKPVNYY